MSGLGDTYSSGLGDDGVLTQAAGYDGFHFDSLPGFGKAFTLAEATAGDGGVSLDSDPLTSLLADHVALPAIPDTVDLVDLGRGLFATHENAPNVPAFHDGTPVAHAAAVSAVPPSFDVHVEPASPSFDLPDSVDPLSLGIPLDALADLRGQVHLAVQGVFEHNVLGIVPVDII